MRRAAPILCVLLLLLAGCGWHLVGRGAGALDPVHVSSGSFTIGVSAYDPESEMLYVPDAASNAVVEMAEDGDHFTEVGSTEIAPGLGLPPTQVYLLDQ